MFFGGVWGRGETLVRLLLMCNRAITASQRYPRQCGGRGSVSFYALPQQSACIPCSLHCCRVSRSARAVPYSCTCTSASASWFDDLSLLRPSACSGLVSLACFSNIDP